MKKLSLTLAFVLLLLLIITQIAYGNMAAPRKADIGSSITFDKNDTISVLSEVLDIEVYGSEANIQATYKMKNTTDKNISTKSMFLSPNIENSKVTIVANDKDTPFIVESYALNYNTEVETENWKYAVLTDENIASYSDNQKVDAITFDMTFLPNEEYHVIVSYTYRLGGYPDSDSNEKEGLIEYYIAPAAMWNDFGSITINLTLDEDMPIISHSNLEFKKIDTGKYQYVSDTLPEENLQITIDENWWQNIFSTLRNPYLPITFIMFLPFIIIALAIIIFASCRLGKKKKYNN